VNNKIAVIGAGPAGMMAAITIARAAFGVTLFEKNEKPGRKLYITGKGRCNLTNNTDIPGLLKNVIRNGKFMHSAFNALDAASLMAFFEELGVPLKTERGGRVFPVSDKATDIIDALANEMRRLSVKTRYGEAVKQLQGLDNTFRVNNGETEYKAVIIATGGLSYPSTGSTGDGYDFARNFNIDVRQCFPSLVPLTTAETWVGSLEGLSLKNIRLTLENGNKTTFEDMGEVMFTKTGLTGPLALSASAYLNNLGLTQALLIDLKPAYTTEELDARLLRDFSENLNKNFINALDSLLPKRLIDTIIELSGIDPYKKVHDITRIERSRFTSLLKALPLTIIGTADFKEAVITRGGVNIKEIYPSRMMSKKVEGLFFAGEVLDTDALTGGYNLQIAFSTGYLAGLSALKYLQT